MADVGMMFTGEMMRALLAGTKTQTRRIAMPRARVGDRIWCRETWGSGDIFYQDGTELSGPTEVVCYAADRSAINFGAEPPRQVGKIDLASWNWSHVKWRPSIHMPKWATRLWLSVLEVRREPLITITDEDALAEGVQEGGSTAHTGRFAFAIKGRCFWGATPREAYLAGWDALNGNDPAMRSAANPLVTVYRFERDFIILGVLR